MALLEIDTTDIDGIEMGRTFTDRDYEMNEFRTRKGIAPDAVREIDLKEDKTLAGEITSDMEKLLYQTLDKELVLEINRGFKRLTEAGACTEQEKGSIMEEYRVTADAYKDYLFSIGYYKELPNGGHYINGSCAAKPDSLAVFHEGLSDFSNSISGIDGPDTPSI